MEEWQNGKRLFTKKKTLQSNPLCIFVHIISPPVFFPKKNGGTSRGRKPRNAMPHLRNLTREHSATPDMSINEAKVVHVCPRLSPGSMEVFWKPQEFGNWEACFWYTKFAGLWTWLFKRKCWHEGHVCTNTNVDPLPSSNGAFTAISVPSGCMPRYTAPKPPSPIRFDLGFSAFQFVTIAPQASFKGFEHLEFVDFWGFWALGREKFSVAFCSSWNEKTKPWLRQIKTIDMHIFNLHSTKKNHSCEMSL